MSNAKIPIQCTEEQLDFICQLLYSKSSRAEVEKLFSPVFEHTNENHVNLAAIKSCFERTDPPRWRAEKGETYHYVNDYGIHNNIIECGNYIDDERHNSGNYFRTQSEAEAVAVMWRELFSKGSDNIAVP